MDGGLHTLVRILQDDLMPFPARQLSLLTVCNFLWSGCVAVMPSW